MTFEPISRDSVRNAFGAALAAGDMPAASRFARHLLREGKLRDAKFVSGKLGDVPASDVPAMRVALLSSFSIEFLPDILIAQSFAEGVRIECHVAGFDQYRQEILDTQSALYRFAPDVVILAVDGARWSRPLYHDYLQQGMGREAAAADEAVGEMKTLIDTFRRHSRAVLLVHNLVPPRWPALGIADGRIGVGQDAAIQRINEQLAAHARTTPGVYAVDVARLASHIGMRAWQDQRMEFFARQPVAAPALNELAKLHVRYIRALAGKASKCLILDLDGTLWGGVVGELGPHGVALGTEYPGNAYVAFQRAIQGLKQRGIILAIASKNNPPDVDEVFEKNSSMLLCKADFSILEVGWHEKSESIARIAKQLNIGLDHMVFVDDNPVECARIEEVLPAVRVIGLPAQPELFVDALLGDGLFDSLSLSAEDLQRAELYRRRDEAETLRKSDMPIEDFYRDLKMAVRIAPVTLASLARAAQMTQKTNQFNATTIRYSEADVAAHIKDPAWWVRTVQVADRFGDHGISGLVMAQRNGDQLNIETFLLSCRVIGRTVETALLARLAQHAGRLGVARLRGRIVPTAKNAPVRDLYERHGFIRGAEDETHWWIEVDGPVPRDPEWLEITEES